MASLSDILTGGLGAFGDYYTSQKGIESARKIGTAAQELASKAGAEAVSGMTFRPFALTTATGGASAAPTGGFTATLSPEMQQARDALLGRSMGMLNLPSIEGAQDDIYAKIRAARQPEIERARLQMEERLFNQGRGGVRTAAFGGTPEQLALEKAILEQESGDFINARNQALAEQLQQFNIGSGMFRESFAPENQLFAALQTTAPFAELATRSNLQGQITKAELERAGIDGMLMGETIASNLQQQQLQALANVLLGRGSNGDDSGGLIGWGADKVAGLFNDWFGRTA